MKRLLSLLLLSLAAAAVAPAASPSWPGTSTFSIAAYDPVTGDLGVAVQSRFLGVGAVVPFARAGVGAIATQAYANTTFGPRGLELLRRSAPAAETLRRLVSADADRDHRQVGVVDARGRAAAWTGRGTDAWAGHVTGRYFTAQGNILAGEEVVRGMGRAFQAAEGDLGDRLLAALAAGQAAGGDRRGQQSAALLVVREQGGYAGWNDRYLDLRVDDHPSPIEELRRLRGLWEGTFGVSAHLESAARFERRGNRAAAELERGRAQAASRRPAAP